MESDIVSTRRGVREDYHAHGSFLYKSSKGAVPACSTIMPDDVPVLSFCNVPGKTDTHISCFIMPDLMCHGHGGLQR